MHEIVGFDELRWLQALSSNNRKEGLPEAIEAKLLTRGLIEHKTGGYTLTARGRIALAKLG